LASCVRNIPTKNYQNLVIGFQVTVKNVGDVFWNTLEPLTIYSRLLSNEISYNSTNLHPERRSLQQKPQRQQKNKVTTSFWVLAAAATNK